MHFEGSQIILFTNIVVLSLKIDIFLVNSADPDEMQHSVAFYLVFTVCQRTCYGVSGPERINIAINLHALMYVWYLLFLSDS